VELSENKHLRGFRETKLHAGETVEHSLEGQVLEASNLGGQLILTNRRLCFYRKGLVGEAFEAIALEKVSSVEVKSLLGFHRLIVHTSNDEMEFRVAGQGAAFTALYQRLEQLIHDKPTAAPAAAPASLADELAKLAGLRDQGIISDAEFDAQKAKLLAA